MLMLGAVTELRQFTGFRRQPERVRIGLRHLLNHPLEFAVHAGGERFCPRTGHHTETSLLQLVECLRRGEEDRLGKCVLLPALDPIARSLRA